MDTWAGHYWPRTGDTAFWPITSAAEVGITRPSHPPGLELTSDARLTERPPIWLRAGERCDVHVGADILQFDTDNEVLPTVKRDSTGPVRDSDLWEVP